MEGVVMPCREFWAGKRVLLTGHTGFKGAWLALWLQRLGADVTGVSMAPPTTPNLFELADVERGMTSHLCDIRDSQALAALVLRAQPEVVLHLAAQALVRPSYRDPLGTLSTNIMGTAHLLDAMRDLPSVKVAVMVTTDKVYHNFDHPYPYREDDRLGGYDPYSASKAASELVIASYRDAYLSRQGVAVASARAGNVIGGGDWAEDRLIPDCVRAWNAESTLTIRRPEAIRPWQHVLEPLAGYLRLAETLWQKPDVAGAYNLGPATHEAATVRNVIEMARSYYKRSDVSYEKDSNSAHEAGWLALETAKARTNLGVCPRWTLTDAVRRTMHWYQAQHSGADARMLCDADISAYEAMS
jgi:CDP-glucose 4,6-dehydratase